MESLTKKFIFIRLILAVFVFCLPLISSSKIFDCFGSLQSILKIKNNAAATSEEFLTDEVSIIFFPGDWHTEIRVGDKMYNTICSTSCRDYDAALKSARIGYKGHISFGIKVTNEELDKIRSLLYQDIVDSISCTGQSCQIISQATGRIIPTPFSMTPGINSIYLAILRLFPNSRIDKINIHTKKFTNLVSPKGIFFNSLEISFFVTLIVAGKEIIVPIFSDKTKD